MIRPISLRSVALTTGRLLSTPISRPFPFLSARCLSSETTTSTAQAPSPALATPSQEATSPSPRARDPKAASGPSAPIKRQLTYLLERTRSKNLAVYNHTKSGGTKKYTEVRKIEGNLQDFKKDVIEKFGFKTDDVTINPVTLHLIIKGHHAGPIKNWLSLRGF